MLRRQLFVFLLIGLFALALGACAKKQTAKVEAPPVTPVTEQPAEPPVEEFEEPAPSVKLALGHAFFDYDKSTLTDEAKQILADNAKMLKEAPAAKVTIEGHCDERGTVAYNLALGERRAKAARDYLVSLGVDAGRFSIISYGKERPFAMGSNEAAWAQNRRAHFVVSE